MEVGLGVQNTTTDHLNNLSLNPCFNGNLVKTSAETKPLKAWAMPWQARLGFAK